MMYASLSMENIQYLFRLTDVKRFRKKYGRFETWPTIQITV